MIEIDHRTRDGDPALTLGMAAIVRHAYEGGDLQDLWTQMQDRIARDANDAAALLDMSMILQTAGQPEQALVVQRQALGLRRSYHRPHGGASGPRVLALAAPGDFMANTPIDFLLQGSDIDLWFTYTDQAGGLADVPDHDLAFLAPGECQANLPILRGLQPALAQWPKPVVNGDPDAIAHLARHRVEPLLAFEPALLTPPNRKLARRELHTYLSEGHGPPFPLLIRPVDTHAGKGLVRLCALAELWTYLDAHPDDMFYVAPFIPYAGPDGYYRKQRVAFIGGQAFPSHFATSPDWMVHYLSAGMTDHPERRAEEAAWMQTFDQDFAVRHAAAFDALRRRVGLDYFGIDCAEAPDGRLLVFEIDVAMIVHDLDPEDLFPYKKPAMRRLFAAFADDLKARAATG